MKKSLNRDVIKYIAIVAMTLDHIAWFFLDFSSPLAQIFHVVGRITAPIMCFFLAQGFRYTSDRKKYALRLFVFAAISQVAWIAVHGYGWFELDFNMIFTLFLSMCALCFTEIKNSPLRYLSLLSIFILCIPCDWMFFAPIFTLVFYYSQNSEKKMCLRFSIAAVACFAFYTLLGGFLRDPLGAVRSMLFMLGLFLCIPLLLMYNGKKGKHVKLNKWFFYIYYPLHLFIIAAVIFVQENEIL